MELLEPTRPPTAAARNPKPEFAMSAPQKVVIVTGASQGIGAALVKAYRDRNYRVLATSRSIMVRVAFTSSVLKAGVASTSTITAASKSIR